MINIKNESKAEDYLRGLRLKWRDIVKANPNIPPERIKIDSSTFYSQEDTTRTFYAVIRLAEKELKYIDLDLKLGVINEEQAKQKKLEYNAVITFCKERIQRVKNFMKGRD